MVAFLQDGASDTLKLGLVVSQVLTVPLDLVKLGRRRRRLALQRSV